MPSGGSIVIEPTEALTVIDVNTGQERRSIENLEDTVSNDLEAARPSSPGSSGCATSAASRRDRLHRHDEEGNRRKVEELVGRPSRVTRPAPDLLVDLRARVAPDDPQARCARVLEMLWCLGSVRIAEADELNVLGRIRSRSTSRERPSNISRAAAPSPRARRGRRPRG